MKDIIKNSGYKYVDYTNSISRSRSFIHNSLEYKYRFLPQRYLDALIKLLGGMKQFEFALSKCKRYNNRRQTEQRIKAQQEAQKLAEARGIADKLNQDVI
jgi:hypothetical protein